LNRLPCSLKQGESETSAELADAALSPYFSGMRPGSESLAADLVSGLFI
jgi:hypothetical protein